MKTPILITAALTAIALSGLIAVVVLTGNDPTIYLFALTSLIPLVGALFGINNLSQTVDTVKTNTNGTNKALQDANATLNEKLNSALALLHPDDAATIATIPATALSTATQLTADNTESGPDNG